MINCIKYNEPISSITHFIGALLSIAALVLMIIFSTKNGNVWHVVSSSIFGSALIFLYLSSAIYHAIPTTNKLKKIFQKIDHSMIFILIAGTYTPIAFVPLQGAWGWSIFGIIWGIAIFGIIIKITEIKIKHWQSILLYILSGWLIIITLPILLNTLPFVGLFWLLLGGLCYTFGTIFFILDKKNKQNKWFGMHEIFHLFVIAGSFSHFWLMLKIIIYIN